MEFIAALQGIFIGNLREALDALWLQLEPLWTALIAIVVSWSLMQSALSRATSATVSAAIGSVFGLVLSAGVLQNLGFVVDSSIATAGDLAGVGGASMDMDTPLAVAQAGVDMLGLAANHAVANIGWAPWTWALQPLVILITGFILLVAYAVLALGFALALVELLVGALVLMPGMVFLGAPGFTQVAYHPVGHMMSCVFRAAGLSFIAAYGVETVQETFLEGMETELAFGACIAAIAVAAFLGLAAVFGDRVITRALAGTAGFGSNVGGAVGHLATTVVSGAAGMVSGGAGAAGAGAAAGGGGGGASGLSGGWSGASASGASRVQYMRNATWARRGP
jgi:hypothetical protein